MLPLTPLEATLNRNIAQSSAAMQLCRRLEGKSLDVTLTGTPFHINMRSDGTRVALAAQQDVGASARLSGSPLALARLGRDRTALTSGSVQIEGDAEVAQSFAELLQAAKPDWEEELSRFVGDVAAHQIGQAARGFMRFGERSLDTLTRNVAEFLQEESRDLATRVEIDEFNVAVDVLRDDVERLSARIERLEHSRFGA